MWSDLLKMDAEVCGPNQIQRVMPIVDIDDFLMFSGNLVGVDKLPVPVLRLVKTGKFVYHLSEARVIEAALASYQSIDPSSSFDMEKSSYGLSRKLAALRRALFVT